MDILSSVMHFLIFIHNLLSTGLGEIFETCYVINSVLDLLTNGDWLDVKEWLSSSGLESMAGHESV